LKILKTHSYSPLIILTNFNFISICTRLLFRNFETNIQNWAPTHPSLASVLRDKADYLKICNSFLKEKAVLCSELHRALDESKELAYATKRFEDLVLNNPEFDASQLQPNGSLPQQLLSPPLMALDRSRSGSMVSLRGNISLVMHLDAIHQNVVRYRLLMERYRKYLLDGDPECHVAEEALQKLVQVSNTVNGFMANADVDKKLLDLHRKLDGYYDVFAPGRRLLHEGELQRQTRKELKTRYLVLVG